MKILLDQGTPGPLRRALSSHEVKTAFECGWDRLENGALLAAAEADGFEVFVTTDQNLQYQQNLTQRRIAIVVLKTANWPRLRPHANLIVKALEAIAPGAFVEVSTP
ncbi:MAG: hypothetical protein A4S17_03230 [Proteobacteria bacterium HN_bin10]|nr:MAG: hypothetical protein A4S17_03230 [Proteobacteria bacterium HN_bin10]